MNLDLTEEEAALVLLLRRREAEIASLYEAGTAERAIWEQEHPGEPYAALLDDGSSGGKAYSLCAETCAEMALAAFNLAADRLGITGWQGSFAELEFLRLSRQIDGPFGIWQAADALYPQYDVAGRIEHLLDSPETVRWMGDCAEYALAARDAMEVSA